MLSVECERCHCNGWLSNGHTRKPTWHGKRVAEGRGVVVCKNADGLVMLVLKCDHAMQRYLSCEQRS